MKGSKMKCKYCDKEINSIDIHEVYKKSLDSIHNATDLYIDHDYFIETRFYCPECNDILDEDEVLLSVKEQRNIKKAEKILVDNGIDPDEAQTVLQAIGYVLMDKELYPENN